MPDTDPLSQPPFNLDADAIAWVNATRAGLSENDRIAQLFVLISRGDDKAELDRLIGLRAGGYTRFAGPDGGAELSAIRRLVEENAIPPLITMDMEGSRNSLPYGTPVINPLGLAATGDPSATADASAILAREGRIAGYNWSFTPCIDISKAFRSAIVGTRSFGSDIDVIEAHGLAHLKALQDNGVAATAKHFPGEGYDDRDQHLLTTVNPLPMDEWRKMFGRLYRAMIDAGVMAVMPGHIALPAFMREKISDPGVEAFRPATVNRLILEDLLRGELGFNGLIVSDATSMAGLGSWMASPASKPELVANGCDVILFSDTPEKDQEEIRAALADGRLTWARVDEAVTRILGFKAALGLHRGVPLMPADEALAAMARPEDLSVVGGITARAPTLVKDVRNLLPLDPEKYSRVLIFTDSIILPFSPEPLPFAVPKMLEEEGFTVTVFETGMTVDPGDFDLMLYLFGDETLLTRGSIFIDWLRLTGNPGSAMRRYWHEVPTLMISFGYPFFLYNAPRVPAYINAYSTLEIMQKTVVDKLMGRSAFTGGNPVDPFCGDEQSKY